MDCSLGLGDGGNLPEILRKMRIDTIRANSKDLLGSLQISIGQFYVMVVTKVR